MRHDSVGAGWVQVALPDVAMVYSPCVFVGGLRFCGAMQFSNNTAAIPDRLIALQEKGEVVFLCGAGISQRYGLPSFYKLTTDVYQSLGESWVGHPAEEDAMGVDAAGRQTRPVALDRALFALSKRLRGTEAVSRLRAERSLIAAIESSVAPGNGPFDAHNHIWTLSRDAEMRGRIVTTNFDTLFERANRDAPSRAGPDLPPPLGTDFAGVLHLHGRIADSDLGLQRTGLVVNSAEFGEAYLRSGWAARYVYDLARASTIVILGYGADDPPMRYILEVLTADRERYVDLREIFAFVPCAPDPDKQRREQEIWETKGATAIFYKSRNKRDHNTLYRTIAIWAAYSTDPTAWRRREAERILRLHPDQLSERDWEGLKWLLGGGDAGELLGDINPSPHWMGPLVSVGLLRSERDTPMPWIRNRLADRDMPSAVAEHIPASRDLISGLERQLSFQTRATSQFDPVLLQAWRIIIQVGLNKLSFGADLNMRWFQVMKAVQAGDNSLQVKREILLCLRPRMTVARPFSWPSLEPEIPSTLRLRHVLRVDWGPRGFDKIDTLVAHWPEDQRQALMRGLSHELESALEEAQDSESLDSASGDVKSISKHEQDRHPEGFYSIVRTIIDLWEADVIRQSVASRALALSWFSAPYLLLRRMGLHALCNPTFSGVEVGDALMALSDEDFWFSDARREIMRLFETRWSGLDESDRERVEQRIADGFPRELLVADASEDRVASIRENAVFIRLSRIEGAGCQLSPAGKAALDAIAERHPKWKSQGEMDDFRIWSSSGFSRGPQGDVNSLVGVAPDKLLDRVREVEDSDPIRQGEIWRLYCDAEPLSALEGLTAGDPLAETTPGAWQTFFWSIAGTDRADIQQLAFAAIQRPGFSFEPVHSILDWLARKRDQVGVTTSDLLALWDRLFDRLVGEADPIEDQDRSDVTFSVLNTPEGKIANLLLDELRFLAFDVDTETRLAIQSKVERIVSAPGKLGFLGSAAVMENLRWYYQEDPRWTEKILIPMTKWNSPRALAAWSILLRGGLPQLPLLSVLKPSLLLVGRHAELDRSLQSLPHWLLNPLIWSQQPDGPEAVMTPVEVRLALSQSVEAVRSGAAFWLCGALEELEGGGANVWRETIGPLFVQAWPIEPSSRSQGATIHLVRMLLRTGDAFAEAVDTVVPALGTAEVWDIEIWLDPDEEEVRPYYESAPAAVLGILSAIVGKDGVPPKLNAMLDRIAEVAPALEKDPRFLKLRGLARRWAAP